MKMEGRVEYMTESQVGVINFDKIKEAYAKENGFGKTTQNQMTLYIFSKAASILLLSSRTDIWKKEKDRS